MSFETDVLPTDPLTMNDEDALAWIAGVLFAASASGVTATPLTSDETLALATAIKDAVEAT